MAIEIVDFPINSMVIFYIAMLNYQRVIGFDPYSFGKQHINPVRILLQAEAMDKYSAIEKE